MTDLLGAAVRQPTIDHDDGGFWGYIGGGRYDRSPPPPEVARTVRLRGMFSFLSAVDDTQDCPPHCLICQPIQLPQRRGGNS